MSARPLAKAPPRASKFREGDRVVVSMGLSRGKRGVVMGIEYTTRFEARPLDMLRVRLEDGEERTLRHDYLRVADFGGR